MPRKIASKIIWPVVTHPAIRTRTSKWDETDINLDIFHVEHLQTLQLKITLLFLGIYMPEEGTQKAVAVKRLNEMNQNQLKIFEREANNMRELDHHCIVRLIGIAPQPPTMVLELVCLGKAILI